MPISEKFIVIFVLCILTGCATTQQAKDVGTSGFLDDYSILRPGSGKDEALLRYVNPIADWKSYTKVLIDPVQLWMGPGSPLHGVPREERVRLIRLLFAKIRDSLLPDYSIVLEPGPRVLRISVALTEAEASNTMLDSISSVLPTGYIVSGTKSMATGTGTYVGTASVEAKITDSKLGTLLAAGVDRRGGAKTLSGVTSEWDDVEQSFQYWASLLRYRLCQWRSGYGCARPEA